MRHLKKILKVEAVSETVLLMLFSNGHYRRVDMLDFLKKFDVQKGDLGYELIENPKLIPQVEVVDYALTWKKISRVFDLPSGKKFEAYYQPDPDVMYQESEPDPDRSSRVEFGAVIRKVRKELGMTQEELANKIGTKKTYISKVENDKSDLELFTLQKIFEIGFGKKMMLSYFDEEAPLSSFSNSVLSEEFMRWAKRHADELELVEGIGESMKGLLRDHSIKNISDLSKVDSLSLLDQLRKSKKLKAAHHPETWQMQSRLIEEGDWLMLIRMQRLLTKKGSSSKTKYSKVEQLAMRDLKKGIYNQ